MYSNFFKADNDTDIYQQTYDQGTYYNPSTSHYTSSGSVTCDRCHKKNLDVCIGYKKCDLCMLCIHEISQRQQNILPRSEYLWNAPAIINPNDKIAIAPFGYDSEGKIRTHWCTTPEHNNPKKLPEASLDIFFGKII